MKWGWDPHFISRRGFQVPLGTGGAADDDPVAAAAPRSRCDVPFAVTCRWPGGRALRRSGYRSA